MSGFHTTARPLEDQAKSRLRQLRAVFVHLFLPERDAVSIYVILAGLTLLGLLLRLRDINQSIAYDEAYTFIHFASREFKHILADYSAPNNHIFHTILMGITYRLFGADAWVLRLPAFVAGILMIPAMFIAARRFFSPYQALGASGLAAVTPLFINYSVNGRGYTLLVLFALLLANFAGILVVRQTRSALIAFALTAALGFYTIPIFLYPMAGISLWVVATYVFAVEQREIALRGLAAFLGACLAAAFLTLLLYSPVVLFGSGLSSITANEIVRSLRWSTFLENLDPRIVKAWNKWMIGIGPVVEYLFLGGLVVSVAFYRRVSNQKLPMQVFLVLAVVVLVVLQRVSPLPRIWIYLEAFYLMFAAAGLVWLVDQALGRLAGPVVTRRVLSLGLSLIFLASFVNMQMARRQNPVFQDLDRLPEAYAADYIAGHLTPQDTIVATGPVDIQAAYYLSLRGISFDHFYKRDHPVDIQNALVMLRKNSKYKTPESVVGFFNLDESLDLSAAELVFEYANVQIYSVPAR